MKEPLDRNNVHSNALRVATLRSTPDAAPAGSTSALEWFVVTDYGAAGDGTTDDSAAVNSLIATAPAGSTLFFPRSTYVFTATILIRKSLNIVGEAGTLFRFSTTTTPSQVGVWFQSAMDSNSASLPYYNPSNTPTYYRTFSGSVVAGDATFTLSSTTGLAVGTYCMLLLGVDPYDATQPYLRLFNRVDSISGSDVTFEIPVPEAINGTSHKCVTFDAIIENCGIENVSIEYDGTFECDVAIYFDKTKNAHARNIVINRWNHSVFVVEASENTTLENIYAKRIEKKVSGFAGSLVGGWGFRNLFVRNAFMLNGDGSCVYFESQGRNAELKNIFCQRGANSTAGAAFMILGHSLGVTIEGFHHASDVPRIVLDASEGSGVVTRDGYLYDGSWEFPLIQHSGLLYYNGTMYRETKHWSKEFSLYYGRPIDIGLPSGVYKDVKVYVPDASKVTYFNFLSGGGDISSLLSDGVLMRPATTALTTVGAASDYPFNATEAHSTQIVTASDTPPDSYGVIEIEYYAPEDDSTRGLVQAHDLLRGLYRVGVVDQATLREGQIIADYLSAARTWTMPDVDGVVLTQDDNGRTAPQRIAVLQAFLNSADEAVAYPLNIKQATSTIAMMISDYDASMPKQATIGFDSSLASLLIEVIQQDVGWMPIKLNPSGGDVLIGNSGGKIGAFGVVGIVQPTTSSGAASFTQGSGNAVNDASTFDGYTLKQIVKALRDLGLLA